MAHGGELRGARALTGFAWEREEEVQARGKWKGEEAQGSTALEGGMGAARQLPACLAWEEDDPALLGWASPAGPGGPGKWLSAFLFLFVSFSAFCFICFALEKIPKHF